MPRHRLDLWPRFHRRHPVATAVLLLIAVVVVWSRWRSPLPGSEQTRYDNQVAICTEVIDGDTLHINIPDEMHRYTRVRLWGVDAPEITHGDQQAMHFGPEAWAWVRSRVQGKRVRIRLAPSDTRDRYQRLLAYVYFGDAEEMLNEQLLREGCAYADSRYDHPWKTRFLELEERARRDRIGLWATTTPERMPQWRRRLESESAPRRR